MLITTEGHLSAQIIFLLLLKKNEFCKLVNMLIRQKQYLLLIALRQKLCTLCEKRETWYKYTLSDAEQYSYWTQSVSYHKRLFLGHFRQKCHKTWFFGNMLIKNLGKRVESPNLAQIHFLGC